MKESKAHSLVIYDAETTELVEVSQEQQRLASYIHQQALLGSFISAMAIKKMFDEKLYLALGCQSRDEYIITMTPFGRRQAYKFYAVASKFDSISKSLTDNELKPLALSDGSVSVQSTALEEAATLGIEKLYELTRLEDDDLENLVKGGKIKLDGQEFEINDFKDMSARDVTRRIKEATDKYKEQINKLSNKNATLQEDNKLLASENKNLNTELDEAKKNEVMYGPAARLLSQKEERLNEARELLNNLDRLVVSADIKEDDPEGLQEDLNDLIKKISEVHLRVQDYYAPVISKIV